MPDGAIRLPLNRCCGRYEKRVLALTGRMCRNPEDAPGGRPGGVFGCLAGAFLVPGGLQLFHLALPAGLQRLRGSTAPGGAAQRCRRPLSQRRGDRTGRADTAPSPQESAERKELREQIEEGLRSLSPEHRQVLILREIHQLSYEEIAQSLELDLGTVKSRINRGRKQLRNFLIRSGNFSPPSASKKTGKEG